MQVQHVAAIEIDEQQRRPRFGQQVAQRIHITVAAKVRHPQRVAFQMDKTGPPTAMGNIDAALRQFQCAPLATKLVSAVRISACAAASSDAKCSTGCGRLSIG